MEGIRQPVLTYIYNRYGKASPTREAVVELRIAFKHKSKYMSTGIRLLPKEWQRGRVVNRLDAATLNKTLDKLMNDVRQVIYDMIEDGNIDIFAIPARLEAKKRKAGTFLDYYAERAEYRKHGVGLITQGRYDHVLKVLRDFGKITHFSDLTERNIIALDSYLKKKGVQATSRWHNYHKFLKRFIVEAQRDGLMKVNPYDTVRLDKGDYDESIDKCLTLEEMKQLQATPMDRKLERVRDLFVFQCYTSLSYSDLARFNAKLMEEVEGKLVYSARRGKTKVRFTVPLLPPALEVLKKYNGKLPIISNTKYNTYLKEVAAAAGIDKPITTHWARHTGATLLLNAGVRMEIVARVLGHSSVKMTEKIYAKLLPQTVVAAINNIDNKL